jgi:hypothetical protein
MAAATLAMAIDTKVLYSTDAKGERIVTGHEFDPMGLVYVLYAGMWGLSI